MFNPDGSEAHCGNALRCVAKFAYERGLARATDFQVETPAGPLAVSCRVEDGAVASVTVNMGAPRLERARVPMVGEPAERVVAEPFTVGDETFEVTCLSMGNPHCVIYVDDTDTFDVERIGSAIEVHDAFPERTNVHFVRVVSRSEVVQRTWERGAGETLACGTGASAVCVAGVLGDVTDRRVTIHARGGDLQLEWLENGDVSMTGPAVTVYEGDYPVD